MGSGNGEPPSRGLTFIKTNSPAKRWLVRRGDRLQETPPKNTPFDVFYYSSEFQDCRVSAILYRFNGNHASERVEEEGKFDIALLCQLLIKPWAVYQICSAHLFLLISLYGKILKAFGVRYNFGLARNIKSSMLG